MIAATECDVSLGEGGPLRRFEARSHLTTLVAQIGAAIIVTWLPIMVLGMALEQTTGRTQPLLHDIAMHVRLLVGIPILLFLDHTFPATCRYALAQLLSYGVITPAELPRFEATMQRVRRLGDFWLPELVIAVLALGFGLATLQFQSFARTSIGRSPVQLWYVAIALPLFEFLLLRSVWRWLVWMKALIGIARLELDLEPTHPDRRGGISFLRVPSLNYCAMLLAATVAVLCAERGSRFMTAETMIDYLPVLLVFAALATLVAFGPLALFIPQLVRARRKGLSAVGSIVAVSGRWCRLRWAEQGPAGAMGGFEAQSLAALVSTYRDTVGQMRLLLVEKKDLVLLLLVTLAPVLLLMLSTMSHDEWLSIVQLLTPTLK